MHTYIYDTYLNDKKYFSDLNKIEGTITDLGLGGRVCRLSPLRSLRDVIIQELKRLPKTLIVVGNDSIVSQAISLMGGCEIPLGIIPIGDQNKIAHRLGIVQDEACAVLSARRLVQIDLGVVDDKTFLKNAEILDEKVRLNVDGKFDIEAVNAKVEVVNYLLNEDTNELPDNFHYEAGQLYLQISKEKIVKKLFKSERDLEKSIIPFNELRVVTENATMMLDGYVKVNNPQKIKVMPMGLRVIVGRQRNF